MSNKKKSLLLIDSHSIIPAEEAKCSFFRRYGIELTLLKPFIKPSVPEDDMDKGYEVIVGKTVGKRPYRALFSTGLARALLRKPDYVLVLSDPFCFWTLQALVMKSVLSPKSRFIFQTWDNIRFTKRNYPQSGLPLFYLDMILERIVFRYSDVVICRNREALDVVKEKGFKIRVEYIPWGVDTDLFCPSGTGGRYNAEFTDKLPVVGYIGRFVPEKGVSVLLEAVAGMSVKVNILLVGAGEELHYLKKLSADLNIETRVKIVEGVSPEQVPCYLNSIDVLVLPSLSFPAWKEQFGRVLAEAMACGVTVIGSSSGAISDVIGDCGFIFKEGDARDLSQKITSVLSGKSLIKGLAERGRKRAVEKFSWDSFARETVKKVLHHETIRSARNGEVETLDLGCGKSKAKNALGIDISAGSDADIVHDLNSFPYPFPDSRFDKIICTDVLEHLGNVITVMEEIHRISKPGAFIEIRVPHFSSCHAYGDPTHRNFFSTESLNFCVPGLANYTFYSEAKFEIVRLRLNFWRLHRVDGVSFLANIFPSCYEKLFAFIFPSMNIEFTLKVLKEES